MALFSLIFDAFNGSDAGSTSMLKRLASFRVLTEDPATEPDQKGILVTGPDPGRESPLERPVNFRDFTGLLTPLGNEENLRVGGFASVGEYVYLGSITVAVKAFLRKLDDNDEPMSLEELRKRVDREARTWITLQHPRIVPLMGICLGFQKDSNTIPSLVTPWYKHGHVMHYLSKNPDVLRIPLITDIAKGLRYLHRHSIIHGDVKPQNALVDDYGRVVLCDFGRTRVEDCIGYTTVNSTSLVYVAPEIGTGGRDAAVTMPGDVYSFAITSLQIVTGSLPFVREQTGSAAMYLLWTGERPNRHSHVSDKDDRVWYVNTENDDNFWAVLHSCWQQDALCRLNMDQVVHRLDSILHRRGIWEDPEDDPEALAPPMPTSDASSSRNPQSSSLWLRIMGRG
ncbi:hypothetical protein HGRIS_004950 [Hohenbuehelia grisea]|uniref:Protein kinase domain-containing protein n=1 Tax=Hohenbuehelia grisea TaxID=104357 RepID=A0ABR3JDH1_9AGAR